MARKNGQGEAAAVIGFAIQSRADMAGGPLEEADAEPCLQLLHRIGDGGAGEPQVLRREGEAAPLDDPGEDPHGVKTVHLNPVTYYS